jgi:transposase-like protein DUF772
MLRFYFLQQWFNRSDPAVEEARYDSAVMRQFMGIDFGCEPRNSLSGKDFQAKIDSNSIATRVRRTRERLPYKRFYRKRARASCPARFLLTHASDKTLRCLDSLRIAETRLKSSSSLPSKHAVGQTTSGRP